jgi:hypothetical protein
MQVHELLMTAEHEVKTALREGDVYRGYAEVGTDAFPLATSEKYVIIK